MRTRRSCQSHEQANNVRSLEEKRRNMVPGQDGIFTELTVNLSISQPQALSTCIHHGACTTNPMCHCVTRCLGPRHPAFPGTPPDPTREIPPSSVSLTGHHQNSKLGKGTSFQPTCPELPRITDVSNARPPTADLGSEFRILYGSCPGVPAML